MAGLTFLRQVGGRLREIAGLQTSAGAGDAGKIPALNSAGQIDLTMMPTGIGPDTKVLVASEALSAGDLVNVWDDAGTTKARKADATAEGKEANGFVLAAATLGGNATVYRDGTITGLTGLTGGTDYYLSAATPGAIVATPPSATGNVVMRVGKALSTTELSFRPYVPVTLS